MFLPFSTFSTLFSGWNGLPTQEKRGKALHDYVSLTRLVDNNLLKGILLEKEKNKKDELEFK